MCKLKEMEEDYGEHLAMWAEIVSKANYLFNKYQFKTVFYLA